MKNRTKRALMRAITAQIAVMASFAILFSVVVNADVSDAEGTEDIYSESSGGQVYISDEDLQQVEDWVSRNPLNESKAWTSNSVSGITITRAVSSTGILAFTPPYGNGGIIWSNDWDYFYTTRISDLMPGDVIAYEEDENPGWLINHIAVVVDVAEDYSWFRTSDGNYTSETGIYLTYRTDFEKRSSHSGRVAVWRNSKHGYDIADSVWKFSRNIIDTHDTSIMDEYERMDMNWCNCYATESLLHVYETTGYITVKNNLGEDTARDFIITLKDRNGKKVNGTYTNREFINGQTTVTLNPGEKKGIEGIPSGYTYTVKAAGNDIPRKVSGTIRMMRGSNVVMSNFKDVTDASASNYKPIYWAADEDIVRGYADGTFRPMDACTRGQFVTMLWRAMGRKKTSFKVRFSDVDESMSSYRAIAWATEQGIIKGYKDGTFRPQEPLTRSQIIVILWRMNGKEKAEYDEGETPVKFSDVSKSSSYAAAVDWAAAEGLIKGYSDGTFRPASKCSRQNIVTILYRADDNNLLD